ncbi:PREDICTED: mediator of RNA polymerase II transcription subunit 23-like isoform X2 [Lupinus angustifolius]|uniref:mediator of RNA polymerase II transcription subunit 23-like isoform X2 n=1 Tax=Lupinus angustifolius TaxID=3871 RepID=UPI00092EA1A0|nr:PREDICTED: mediator of RNA polymerase II transcription subunit 23-like isoform X2 [Lupinus angustifolius]
MSETEKMDQIQKPVGTISRPHPSRILILNLFNLYLGRNSLQKRDDLIREPPNKAQKRVLALNRELPPPNEQFLQDFMQLKNQFPDQDQIRSVTESILILLVVQCSSHGIRAEFVLYAIRSLCSVEYINWDTFLPSLLSSVSSAEFPVDQGNQLMPTVYSSNFQPSNSASQLPSIHPMGYPARSTIEPLSSAALSPVKSPDTSYTGQHSQLKVPSIRNNDISSLRQLCCKIILIGLEFDLKPMVYSAIFNHMLSWLVNWDQRQQGIDEPDAPKSFRPDKAIIGWMHSCLDVIWLLVDEGKCRVPFYELLHSDLQFMDNIPDDEAIFTLILEIHRRRDMMAMNMQMLDQHLHCPTFGTHRILTQAAPNVSAEAVAHLRLTPITYLSVLGEPLHGEDIASSIQKGSLDWERALRCIRHAIRTTPSPDWWRRVLLLAPCYRPSSQGLSPGAVFSSEMICEATIDRVVELLILTNSEINCWQDWLVFSDIFFFLIKNGCIDFVDFVDKLVSRLTQGDQHILKTNHVTWLFAQIMRVELVMNALNSDARKMETTRKILSFHREERNSDSNSPQSILLDFVSSCQSLCIWSLNSSTREFVNNELRQKGKLIDEWWKQVSKGDRMMDYMNMDKRSLGMFWVLSYTMTQPACETILKWLTSAGVIDLLSGTNLQPTERLVATREVSPLPMSLLSGMSMGSCMKLSLQLEESLFSGQVVPSIAMVETYTRVLLISPHSLFRSHFSHLAQKNPSLLSKPGVRLLVLEILNYRLLPLYRYEGKTKSLMYDVTKVISALKGKRGDHRVFRLAENLCLNLIFSLRDFFMIKREGKGPTEFTETLNRETVITLAILIKTRGIANAEHMLYLRTMIEQILATSTHTWSEKTLRYFPSVLREALSGLLIDKRSLAVQAWQQAETIVLHQCTQILSSSADASYVTTYIGHSFPQHRQYLCAGAWILMHGHAETINGGNLGRVLGEFSPEEVTSNIYTMVDVLLHHMQMQLQQGHALQDLLLKACASLGFFVWTNELLPLDILLLALIDRDDDPHALRIVISLLDRQELQQRVKHFCMTRGHHEHWLYSGIFKRVDPSKALGNYLSWKDRYPVFFDDIAARLLPVIPLIIYRLIENDAMEPADRILALYSSLLVYYPLRFSFVRDILSYFYGHLPAKLIVRILQVLDINKIPFSVSFPQQISSSNPATCPPLDYFGTLLLGIVNNVIPQLHNSKSGSMEDASNNALRTPPNKPPGVSQPEPENAPEGKKAFYQIQDPGTYTQLVLETAVVEILSLPVSASQIVHSLVQIIVNIQSMLIQSSNGLHGGLNGAGQGSVFPTSPSGGSSDSLGASRSSPSVSGINTSNFAARSGYTWQQLSCLLIQACGLLLSQLPSDFHFQFYLETTRIIKENWWIADGKRSLGEIDSAIGYALLDPTSAAENNTSTPNGNVVALLHSFFSNLPLEWLERTHVIIKQLQPVTSVAMLRIAFRIMGPLLPKLVGAHALFNKTLSLLLSIVVDVFGTNSQHSTAVEASEITDLIDFIHHVVHYEGQGGPVQASSKPRPEVLALIESSSENLRPDIRHLMLHLKTNVNSSIYAAMSHPK